MADTWPTSGPDFNSWNLDLPRFTKLLDDVKDHPWWCADSQLKYLEIRIDTRDNGFLLFDRDRNRVSPDRVVEAIKRWNETFLKRTDSTMEGQD